MAERRIPEADSMIDLSSDICYSRHRIVESKNDNPSVLCTVEGIAMDIGVKNENERIYSLSLIVNRIVKLPYTVRMMAFKTLFGESHHPKDRNEIWFDEACISIIDLWVDEKEEHLYIRYDVLDTPKGRILKTLIDYGSTLGVSARARGKTLKKKDGFYVDEKSYLFKTFDVVTNPGFMDARPDKIEEEEQDIVQAFKSLLEDYDEDTANRARMFIEYSESKELKNLLEESESNEPESEQTNELQEELERVLEENNRLKFEREIQSNRIKSLVEEIRILKRGSADEVDEEVELLRERHTVLVKRVGSLQEEVISVRKDLRVMTEEVGRLNEENEGLRTSNQKLAQQRHSYKNLLNEEVDNTEVPRRKVPRVPQLATKPIEANLDEEVSKEREVHKNERLVSMIPRVRGY